MFIYFFFLGAKFFSGKIKDIFDPMYMCIYKEKAESGGERRRKKEKKKSVEA